MAQGAGSGSPATPLAFRSAINYDCLIRRDHCGALRLHPLVHLGSVQTAGQAMTTVQILSAVSAAGLAIYLLYALIKPEKF
jgi:K+-transporting ATPase KdpF subunit